MANRPEHPKLFFLPEELIQLRIEIGKHHQHLMKKYPELATGDFTVVIAALAAEVNIAVEGMFDDEGIKFIAEQIRSRLVARRTTPIGRNSIILPPNFTKQ